MKKVSERQPFEFFLVIKKKKFLTERISLTNFLKLTQKDQPTKRQQSKERYRHLLICETTGIDIQGDQLYMAVFLWYLILINSYLI